MKNMPDFGLKIWNGNIIHLMRQWKVFNVTILKEIQFEELLVKKFCQPWKKREIFGVCQLLETLINQHKLTLIKNKKFQGYSSTAKMNLPWKWKCPKSARRQIVKHKPQSCQTWLRGHWKSFFFCFLTAINVCLYSVWELNQTTTFYFIEKWTSLSFVLVFSQFGICTVSVFINIFSVIPQSKVSFQIVF